MHIFSTAILWISSSAWRHIRMHLFRLHCYWDSIRSVLPVYVLRTHFYVYRYAYVFFARSVVNIQHSIGCLVVFLVWRHHLRKVNKSSVRSFRRFFLQFSYCLMFLNIPTDLIILKTHDQQFTLRTKNHCISSLRSLATLDHSFRYHSQSHDH